MTNPHADQGDGIARLTQRDFDETVDVAIRVAETLGATMPGAAGYLSGVLQDERKHERQRGLAECARLAASLAADADRLAQAGARVGITVGCDTPDWMAEEILALRAERDRLAASLPNCSVCDVDRTKGTPEICGWHYQRVVQRLADEEAENERLTAALAEQEQKANRLATLAGDISGWLREAGCPAMPIPEGVKWLLHRAEQAEASIAEQEQRLKEACDIKAGLSPILAALKERDDLRAELAAERQADLADPCEQRAARYAMEAADLSRRLIALEAEHQQEKAKHKDRLIRQEQAHHDEVQAISGGYEADLAAVRQELEQSKAKLAGAERQIERWAICPDHRDKATGECVVCRGERRGKEEERERSAAVRQERDAAQNQCADAERFANEQEQRAIKAEAERDALKAERDGLVFAVGQKFPGESRYATALRYIQQAEASANTGQSAAPPVLSPGEAMGLSENIIVIPTDPEAQ